jgi:hypothetical protein
MLIFVLTSHDLFSQKNFETGLPLIKNYGAEDYGAFEQNWAAAKDSLGIMYFANGDGVLSYDGVNWSVIELPNKGTVFAVKVADDGLIYVGAVGELGFLKQNAIGELTYISLLSQLPDKFHDFNEIKSICTTESGVFFGSKKYIFKWDGSKFETWEVAGDGFVFSVHHTLFNRKKGQGLMALKNKEFELIPQGELFAEEKIYSIIPFNDKNYLIATTNGNKIQYQRSRIFH